MQRLLGAVAGAALEHEPVADQPRRPGGLRGSSPWPRRSSASRRRAAAPPGRRPRAAPRDRGRASPRRPASRGACRGCRRCGGAGSRRTGGVSGIDAERRGGIVDGRLERRARVRRAERHHVRDQVGPVAADMARAARHEPAHRVTDEHDLLDLVAPPTSSSSASASERPFSEMWRPRVEAHVDRREAVLGGEAVAVARPAAVAPRELGLEQAVDEHREPRRGSPSARSGHRDRQLAALALEHVAPQPVEHGEQRAARPRARAVATRRRRAPASTAPPWTPA